MAGRGRGRGRGGGGMPLNLLELQRGEKFEPSQAVPPPDFPELRRTIPLTRGEDYDYLLKVRESLRSALRVSPYYMECKEEQQMVDLDFLTGATENTTQITMNWSRFPKELQPVTKRVVKKKKKKTVQVTKASKKLKITNDDIEKTLAELENKEGTDEDQDERSEKGDKTEGEDEDDDEEKDGEGSENEEFDEDDLEEETDYVEQHFDNGEDYLEAEEDNLDDAVTY